MTPFYWLLGAFLAFAAWRNLRDGHTPHAGFWAMVALLFLGGDWALAQRKLGNPIPVQIAGACILALAVFALKMQRHAAVEAPIEQRRADALRLGHTLFFPALLIPLITVLVVFIGEKAQIGGMPLFAKGANVTLIGLSIAGVIATLAAIMVTRKHALQAPEEGRRLLDAMGWAALLPIILAMLGGVFKAAGVGDTIAELVSSIIPTDSRLACVLAYGLGMVVFTMIMGNAFAAFPVMTAGIGLPLLIHQHGAAPAVLGAIGMLTGYCGTLMTPMAANYNLVPAALLELKDSNGVIRAQIGTAIPLLIVNLLLMYVLVFR